MQRICTALAKANYSVLLIGRSYKNSEPLSEQPYQQKRLNCFFNRSFLFYAEYNIRLFFLLLFTSFDVLCSIDLDTILPGYFVAKLKQKKLVHDAHELFTEMPELNENKLAKNIWIGIEKFTIPRIQHAYTESEGYQSIYAQYYPETPFQVIRNVPFYYTTARTIHDGEYILYQGALNVGRGLEQAIEAMKEIDYPLWLAGEGDVSEQLRQQVKKLNLEETVRFLGWVKPADLREITANAKIGLNLLDPTNRHYQLSFPNKLFDYIMAELPQISMNFPNYNRILGEKNVGVLVNDLQVKTIQNAIERLLTNEDFYDKCIKDCKELKEIHNWNNEQEKLLLFYNQL